MAELCECDLATIVRCDEAETLRRLDRLEGAGVLDSRTIDGMRHLSLAAPELRRAAARLGPGDGSESGRGAETAH